MEGERAKARRVLADARSGTLSVESFHARWPESSDPLIAAIFEETEDTVEHVPGTWFRGRRDDQGFRRSPGYKALVVDEQLLLDEFASISSEQLVAVRERLLQSIDLEQDEEAVIAAARAFVMRAVAEP